MEPYSTKSLLGSSAFSSFQRPPRTLVNPVKPIETVEAGKVAEISRIAQEYLDRLKAEKQVSTLQNRTV